MKKIQLSGKNSHLFTLVDDEDYEEVRKSCWYLTKGYAVRGYFKNNKYGKRLQRVILKNPIGLVDHKNHNKLDNRKQNLRIVTNQQNVWYQRKNRVLTSRFKGVSWYKKDKKWQVQITFNKKDIYLGRFEDEKRAALAYNVAAQKYFGEYAYLNKIKESV